MHPTAWIFVAILSIALLPVLFEILIVVGGGLFMFLGVLLECLFGVLVLVFGVVVRVLGFLIGCVLELILFVGRFLVSPIEFLERQWRRRQTVMTLGGVLVFAIIVLLAYLTR